jgi:hypothetical protein
MKKRQLVIVVIAVMVMCSVGLSYLFKDALFSSTTTDEGVNNNIKQPLFPTKPDFITLDDGSIVTGDFDKFLLTKSSTFSSIYMGHEDLETFKAFFTGENIVDKILNSITVTVRFYAGNNEFLSENTTQTKYLPPGQEWTGEVARLRWQYVYYPGGGRGGMECDHVSYHITVS